MGKWTTLQHFGPWRLPGRAWWGVVAGPSPGWECVLQYIISGPVAHQSGPAFGIACFREEQLESGLRYTISCPGTSWNRPVRGGCRPPSPEWECGLRFIILGSWRLPGRACMGVADAPPLGGKVAYSISFQACHPQGCAFRGVVAPFAPPPPSSHLPLLLPFPLPLSLLIPSLVIHP